MRGDKWPQVGHLNFLSCPPIRFRPYHSSWMRIPSSQIKAAERKLELQNSSGHGMLLIEGCDPIEDHFGEEGFGAEGAGVVEVAASHFAGVFAEDFGLAE